VATVSVADLDLDISAAKEARKVFGSRQAVLGGGEQSPLSLLTPDEPWPITEAEAPVWFPPQKRQGVTFQKYPEDRFRGGCKNTVWTVGDWENVAVTV
jgi:hypothetical protein